MRKIYSGTKFFRYIDGQDSPEMVRIYSTPSEKSKSDSVLYFDKDGNKKRMSLEYLLGNYKMLKVDGLIMFSIVSIGEAPDVIVALQDLKSDQPSPYAICRQGISDVFSNMTKKTDVACYVGISISRDTCPADINFDETMVCTDLKYYKPIAVYIDDTLDDILKLFSNKRFDNALIECKKAAEKANQNNEKVFLGFNNTLKELLEANTFMYDFRKCFNITELPFSINEESEILSAENVLFLEHELKVNIMETYVIKYSKEIDLSSIKRNFILASSAQDNFSDLYIVGYDTADGEYVPRTMI